MSLDITPLVAADRQLIQGYGDGHFTVAGARHVGSVLILPGQTLPWSAKAAADTAMENLQPITNSDPQTEILILGGGPTTPFVDPELREALKAIGIIVEPMDTGAACRTFNVLLAEERRVAAALIATP